MPYRYREDVATADVAFEAQGDALETLFRAAADATMNVMIEDIDRIEPRVTRDVQLEADAVDMLLFDFLQELIYHKDSDRLLLRVRDLRVEQADADRWTLAATFAGEPLDEGRHEQNVDVKAVTLHRFSVERTDERWEAFVVLDI